VRRKITLILPRGPLYRFKKGIFKRNLQYAPLTLTSLASLIPGELELDVEIIDEGIEEVPPDLDSDLVGISAITGSANRSYELADSLRRRGIPVVLGGVHATLMPGEAGLHADSVVTGFAEETFPELLRDFICGRLKKFYIQPDNFSLENIPLPRRDLLKRDSYIISDTVQATRGCTNNCDFCVVPAAWRKRMYFRPVKDVIKEIEELPGRDFLFLDVSPIENKQYAKELFKELIPLGKRWASPLTIKITHDEEMFDLAVKSGCRAVLIGFESLSEESIKSMNKGFNLVREYKESIRKLHANGVAIMGCFVFGCDGDSPEVFKRTVDFVIDAKIDLPRYTVYTPYPGTPLYERLRKEDRIIEDNWDYYDAQHVVFQPRNMSPDELYQGLLWSWEQTYRYRSIAKRLLGNYQLFLFKIVANLGYRFYALHLDNGL
jgi:radical SAM superfamily enzyme YgiQ (UPF0313 family)